MRLIRTIRGIYRKFCEEYSFNPISTIYYNFKFLPFSQAIKVPILLNDIKFHRSDAKVEIQCKKIEFGMIKIGVKYNDLYHIRKKSHYELCKGGKVVFHGRCSIGKGGHVDVEPNGLLEFEDDVNINAGLNLYAFYKIKFGKGCRIGFETTILDSDFHAMYDIVGKRYVKTYSPIEIGENCWIGMKTIIKKGTKIYPNNIIASASVVSGLFRKENCIIQGNPANVVAEGYRINPETFYEPVTVRQKAYK